MSKNHKFDPDKVIKQRNFEIFTLAARIYYTVSLFVGIFLTFLSVGITSVGDVNNIGTGLGSLGVGIVSLIIGGIGFVLWWVSLVLSIIANNISAETKSPSRGLAITSMVLAIVSIIPYLNILINIAGIVVSGILVSKLNNQLAGDSSHVVEVEAKEVIEESKSE